MDSAEAQRLLRLALSYRTRAHSEIEACDRALSNGGIEQTQHAAVHAACQAHLDRANTEIERLRNLLHRELTRLSKDLRAGIEDQKRLAASLREGRTAPKAASDTSQRLEAHLSMLRQSIAEFNALHAAKAPEDVGGFIDVSLDRYSQSMQRLPGVEEEPNGAAVPKKRRPPVFTAALLVLLSAAALAMLIHRALLGGSPSGGLHIEGKLSPTRPIMVFMTCTNDGLAPVILHVPWNEEVAVETAEEPAEAGSVLPAQYGVTVSIRESGDAAWRPMASSEGCWRQYGLLLRGEDTFTIEPGLSLELALDTDELAKRGVAPKAIKLDLCRAGGRSLASFEAVLKP